MELLRRVAFLSCGDCVVVVLGGGLGGRAHSEARPVWRPGGVRDAVGGVEFLPDRRACPGGGPCMVVYPAMCGRSFLQPGRESGLQVGTGRAVVVRCSWRAGPPARLPGVALWWTGFSLTCNSQAIQGIFALASKRSAARVRSSSRRLRCSAVSPPSSGYRMPPAGQPSRKPPPRSDEAQTYDTEVSAMQRPCTSRAQLQGVGD